MFENPDNRPLRDDGFRIRVALWPRSSKVPLFSSFYQLSHSSLGQTEAEMHILLRGQDLRSRMIGVGFEIHDADFEASEMNEVVFEDPDQLSSSVAPES